ncbi:MAG: hypothetical protein QM770_25340 [Tepidisphaeraceae bacterium]
MDDVQPTRTRSPNHPAASLAEAVARCKAVFQKHGRGYFLPRNLAAVWELSDKSSHFWQIVASLRQYGLIEGHEHRHLRLTQRGVDLALLPPTLPEHRKALATAAIAPPIFNAIATQLPADADETRILHFIVSRHRFSHEAALKVVKAYLASREYARTDGAASTTAGLPATTTMTIAEPAASARPAEATIASDEFVRRIAPTATVPSSNGPIPPVASDRPAQETPVPYASKPDPASLVESSMCDGLFREFVIYLPQISGSSLRVPTSLSRRDFTLLQRQLETHMAVIEALCVRES